MYIYCMAKSSEDCVVIVTPQNALRESLERASNTYFFLESL